MYVCLIYLFMIYLTTLSYSDYMASNGVVINERGIGMDVKGSARDLF
jgi:hypothetical protein